MDEDDRIFDDRIFLLRSILEARVRASRSASVRTRERHLATALQCEVELRRIDPHALSFPPAAVPALPLGASAGKRSGHPRRMTDRNAG